MLHYVTENGNKYMCPPKSQKQITPPVLQSESLVLYTYVLVGGAQKRTVVIVCGCVHQHLDLAHAQIIHVLIVLLSLLHT